MLLLELSTINPNKSIVRLGTRNTQEVASNGQVRYEMGDEEIWHDPEDGAARLGTLMLEAYERRMSAASKEIQHGSGKANGSSESG